MLCEDADDQIERLVQAGLEAGVPPPNGDLPPLESQHCHKPPHGGYCQLDTTIHLWRITAHNAVHRCEVAEMLKAPPQDFRTGAVAPPAPHLRQAKTCRLRKPLIDLS